MGGFFMLVSNLQVSTLKNSDEKNGFVISGVMDLSISAEWEVNINSLMIGGIGKVVRSIVVNNSANTSPINAVFDRTLKYPNEIAGGQIRTFQVPKIEEPSDVIFSSTLTGSTTIVPFFLYSDNLNPDTTGGSGSVVTVANTVAVDISGSTVNLPVVIQAGSATVPVVQTGPTGITPFDGIIAAGNTVILSADAIIYRMKLYLSGNTTLATAGSVTAEVLDGTKIIGYAVPEVGTAAIAGADEILDIDFGINGYSMSGGSLNINLGTALTGSGIYGYVTKS